MSKTLSRTSNSIRNSIFGIAASLVSIVLNFGVRFVLIKTLGEEINGLHNLFQNITNVLLLMELGISSAMIIHLYEPVTIGDNEQMSGILSFYRTVYRYIALAFFLTSIVVSLFFLKHLVHTTLPFHQVQLYFQLFNLTFVLNYLTNYKRSLLFAAQKNRVSVFFNSVAELTFRIGQILILLMFKGYLFFLLLTIFEKLTSNILCNRYIERHYPFLRQPGQELASAKRQAIMTTVKSLMLNNVAGTVQQSSRSLLISMLLGNISIVGYYGNYQLIISVVELIYSQIGGALTSSFGSLAIEKDQQRLQAAYKKAAFVLNWLAAICCAGFLICVQDFIQLLFGKGFLLEFSSVLLLTFGLMLYLLNIPIISLQNALGLHHLDAYYMLLQAGLAVAFGYVSGFVFGMAGIFAGVILPMLLLTVIRKGMVVSSYALGMSHRSYLSFLSYESLKIILVSVVSYLISSYLSLNLSFVALIIKVFVVLIVGLILPIILSSRQAEQIYIWQLLRHRLKK